MLNADPSSGPSADQTNPAGAGFSADSERLLVLLAYALFLVAPPAGGLTALAGAALAHLRLAPAAGQVCESHYRNMIRVFWIMLAYAVAMILLLTVGLGLSLFTLAWPLAPSWFAYGWPGWAVVTAGHVALWMLLLPLAGLLSLAMGVWYYWRLLRGFLRILNDRPY